MANLIGPDFIGIQTADLEGARAFYAGMLGLEENKHGPEDAIVFNTKPIPFAVRTPLSDLNVSEFKGLGIALWFGCTDADELHKELIQKDVPIVFPPKDGPFGRYFAFKDPFGYTITAHTVKA